MASTSPRPTASDCSTLASSSHHHGDGAAEPVGAHDSPTPSHHGSGDAREMDDALAEKLKDEETRPQPEADVQSMPVTDGDQGVSVLRFGLPELEEATGRFDESARIGSAGNGRTGVYRGSLRGMSVAVSVISPDAAVGETRFAREADAIGKVGLPGIVAFVGACAEARAVVHELVRAVAWRAASLKNATGRRRCRGERDAPWRTRYCLFWHSFFHSSAKTVTSARRTSSCSTTMRRCTAPPAASSPASACVGSCRSSSRPAARRWRTWTRGTLRWGSPPRSGTCTAWAWCSCGWSRA
ncbi:uncharacterized protein [Triticum aestivum]|uniref:uncharacterized protein n=1 Tax=Triticum aestivum TaxID=4565 RepID=UPI001D0118D9|nr:uncharacterized protein LOC123158620 [Triticum aestivum]